jgi:hypothetical protein
MNKTIFPLLGLLLSACVVNAQTNDLTWVTNEDGTIAITGYAGPTGGPGIAVTIPLFINGLPVTSVAADSFKENSEIASVTFSTNITNIGEEAFYECETLTNVTILGQTDVGTNAFAFSTNLVGVSISGGSIEDGGFWACTSLANYGEGPLPPLTGLSNIIIGDGVTNIGEDAFASSLITRLSIPGSVTDIQTLAFYECPELKNVIFGGGLTNIDTVSFSGCTNLINVLFLGNAPSVTHFGDEPVFERDPAIVYYLPGTTGWSNYFGSSPQTPLIAGVPTALWNPVIQASGPGFGVSNGQFGFNITGTANIPIVVEACTNLANPVWTPLTNMTLTNGSVYFSDPNWSSFSVRYYGIGFP